MQGPSDCLGEHEIKGKDVLSKLKIYSFPDDVLSEVAEPIRRVDANYWKLADDMLETMYDAPGIGLAANQVGILERVIVIDTDFEIQDDGLIIRKSPRIFFNPELVLQEGETAMQEGCLSVPEYTAEVPRAEKIKLQYQDADGLTKTLSAEGLLAVCIQHEMDHLNGQLFIDRLSPLKREMAQKKLIKDRKRREREGTSRLKPGSGSDFF